MGLEMQLLSTPFLSIEMKIAGLTPVYKKDDSNIRNNYRPISVLLAVSKLCKRVLKDQISPYFHAIHSNILYGFRADCRTQKCFDKIAGKMEEMSE